MRLNCLFVAFAVGIFFKNPNEIRAFRGGLESTSEDCNDMWQAAIEEIIVEPEDNVILGHRGVVLNCFKNNNEKVTWFYNNKNISESCGIFKCQVLSNGSLEIFKLNDYNKSINKNTKHEFYCTQKRTIGVWQSRVRSPSVVLTIADFSGNVTVHPEKISAHEGELVRFECNVMSTPPAIVTWFHNGRHIEISENSDKYFLGQLGELYINSTNQSNSGSYHCTAKNKYTYDDEKSSNSATLNVTNPVGIVYNKKLSIHTEQKQIQEVVNGERLTMICAASGYPLPTVTWIVFNSSGMHELSRNIGIGILDFKNAQTYHTGEYYCDVENKNDNPISRMTVKVGTLPHKQSHIKNQIIKKKNQLFFKCVIDGDPKPQITWFKNTQKLKTKDRRILFNGDSSMLAMKNVTADDTGVYQCFGKNIHGVYAAAVEFQYDHMKDPGWIPTSVECESKSETEIEVSWVEPLLLRQSKMKAYTVEWSKTGVHENNTQPELSMASGETSTVIKNLKSYQNYSISIRSWSPRRCSQLSMQVTCATMPARKRENLPIIDVYYEKIPATLEVVDNTLGIIIGVGMSVFFIVVTFFYIRFLKRRAEIGTSSSADENSAQWTELTESQESSRTVGYPHTLGIVYERNENRNGDDSEDFLVRAMAPTDFDSYF